MPYRRLRSSRRPADLSRKGNKATQARRGLLRPKAVRQKPRSERYGLHPLDATLAENDDRASALGWNDIHRSPVVQAVKEIVEYWIANAEGLYSADELSSDELLELLGDRARLTTQQCRILELFLDGHSEREVAKALELSRAAVRTHRNRALAKVRSRWITGSAV